MKNLLLILAVVALIVLPLLFHRTPASGEEFTGADGQASEAVAALSPGYTPWAKPLLTPPSSEIEGLLFALQAAIGAGIIGFFFGRAHALKTLQSRPPTCT